jgi:siroheme synthase-like protein
MSRSKKYYPVFLDLESVSCLVVGGGKVAQRKVETLLSAGALVTIVSPDLTPALARLCRKGKIRHVMAEYQKGHLENMRLVIGATGSALVNEHIFNDAEDRGILSNIVDTPAQCRFIVPAVLRYRDISIAICTGGAAPAVSAILKRDLEKNVLPRVAPLVAALKKMRGRIKTLPHEKRMAFWERVKTTSALMDGLKKPGPERPLRKWLDALVRGTK